MTARNPARGKAICNVYLSGRSLAETGAQFGISHQRVSQILFENGIANRHREGIPMRLLKASASAKRIQREAVRAQRESDIRSRNAEAVRLYIADEKLSLIAEVTGYSHSQVCRLARLAGIPKRVQSAGSRNPPKRRERRHIEPLYSEFPGWRDDVLTRLQECWLDYSASEIGTMLATSRNAVIGKAHRLHLPAKREAYRQGASA